MLKKIGIGLAGLLVLLLAVSFVLPAHVHVERSTVIKSSAKPVFEHVNTLKNWEKWSPWHQIDPKMKLAYEGPQFGVGAKYTWMSNHEQVGNGALTIKESVPFKTIVTEMDFMENGIASSSYIFEESTEGTKVIWSMDYDNGYNPVARYFGLLMDGFIGPDFERGLQNLKNVIENQPVVENTSAQAI